jgi:hypothetical protein
LARLGNFEEAKELLDRLESQQRSADLRSRLELQGVRAILRYEQGERLQALADFQALQQAYERTGCAIGTFSMSVWVARILFALGRRHEALELLERTEAQANAIGVSGAVQMALRVRGEDPLCVAGGEKRVLPGDSRNPARTRAYAAVRAAAEGDVLKVHGLLQANASETAGPGYALERALGHLALAISGLREGKADDSTLALTNAQRIAVEGEVDPDLLPELAKLFTVPGACIQINESAASNGGQRPDNVRVLLDPRTHQLRAGRKVISFHKRPILRKLLYALAQNRHHPLSKEELAACLWPSRYNPNIHDNALLVNLSRLRSVIADVGLKIDYDGEGYFLSTRSL